MLLSYIGGISIKDGAYTIIHVHCTVIRYIFKIKFLTTSISTVAQQLTRDATNSEWSNSKLIIGGAVTR